MRRSDRPKKQLELQPFKIRMKRQQPKHELLLRPRLLLKRRLLMMQGLLLKLRRKPLRMLRLKPLLKLRLKQMPRQKLLPKL